MDGRIGVEDLTGVERVALKVGVEGLEVLEVSGKVDLLVGVTGLLAVDAGPPGRVQTSRQGLFLRYNTAGRVRTSRQ